MTQKWADSALKSAEIDEKQQKSKNFPHFKPLAPCCGKMLFQALSAVENSEDGKFFTARAENVQYFFTIPTEESTFVPNAVKMGSAVG
jgi:hypothetical protein